MKTSRLISLSILSVILCSCSLLNSGTAHVKYTVSKATFDGEEYENVERLSDVSFSVRNVQHPKTYGQWNFNFRFVPSIHGDKAEYQSGGMFTDSSGVYRNLPNIKIKRVSSFGNLKLTFHTPLGAFVATGGFGGAFYHQDNDEDVDTYKTTEIRKIDFSWVVFLSDRFFLLVGPRFYTEQYEQYVFAFRIGYFWGKASES